MKSRRRSDGLYELDALTRAALSRDTAEAVDLVHELAKGSDPLALTREAKACTRRLRSVEGLRTRLGLPPIAPGHRAIAV